MPQPQSASVRLPLLHDLFIFEPINAPDIICDAAHTWAAAVSSQAHRVYMRGGARRRARNAASEPSISAPAILFQKCKPSARNDAIHNGRRARTHPVIPDAHQISVCRYILRPAYTVARGRLPHGSTRHNPRCPSLTRYRCLLLACSKTASSRQGGEVRED